MYIYSKVCPSSVSRVRYRTNVCVSRLTWIAGERHIINLRGSHLIIFYVCQAIVSKPTLFPTNPVGYPFRFAILIYDGYKSSTASVPVEGDIEDIATVVYVA